MENNNFFMNEDNQLISAEDMQKMLGQTISIAKNNAETTAGMLTRLENAENIIGGISKKIYGITDEITNMTDRLNNLEYSAELTTSQVSIFVEKSRARVYDFLTQGTEDEKYYRVFILDLYKFLKRYGKASKIERTEKRFYDSIIRGISEWIPNAEKLKAKKDMLDSLK
jgi:hypothetical protein